MHLCQHLLKVIVFDGRLIVLAPTTHPIPMTAHRPHTQAHTQAHTHTWHTTPPPHSHNTHTHLTPATPPPPPTSQPPTPTPRQTSICQNHSSSAAPCLHQALARLLISPHTPLHTPSTFQPALNHSPSHPSPTIHFHNLATPTPTTRPQPSQHMSVRDMKPQLHCKVNYSSTSQLKIQKSSCVSYATNQSTESLASTTSQGSLQNATKWALKL